MATLRGRLVRFDGSMWRAVVRLEGSASMELTNVAVSRAIPAGEMVAGRRALVDTGDAGDAAEAILTAIVA
ncbi:MAG: hypothetical protein F4Y54_06675 [Dehalococcoidia bacterium]|nr:hypothetical protein [Dehalococcoidia bacterium]